MRSARGRPATGDKVISTRVTPASSRAFWTNSPTSRPLPCSSACLPRPVRSTSNQLVAMISVLPILTVELSNVLMYDSTCPAHGDHSLKSVAALSLDLPCDVGRIQPAPQPHE